MTMKTSRYVLTSMKFRHGNSQSLLHLFLFGSFALFRFLFPHLALIVAPLLNVQKNALLEGTILLILQRVSDNSFFMLCQMRCKFHQGNLGRTKLTLNCILPHRRNVSVPARFHRSSQTSPSSSKPRSTTQTVSITNKSLAVSIRGIPCGRCWGTVVAKFQQMLVFLLVRTSVTQVANLFTRLSSWLLYNSSTRTTFLHIN